MTNRERLAERAREIGDHAALLILAGDRRNAPRVTMTLGPVPGATVNIAPYRELGPLGRRIAARHTA